MQLSLLIYFEGAVFLFDFLGVQVRRFGMLAAQERNLVSIDDYSDAELSSNRENEYIEGRVCAMAGASINHERICMNLAMHIGLHLKNSPCESLGADIKLKVAEKFFYPDFMVDCALDEPKAYYTETPSIIIEVLSKSTRRMDETTKLMSYINMPSVQEYVLIEQDVVDIQVLRRSEGWLPMHYFLGDDVKFESIDLSVSVGDIYARVQNEDMLEFLNRRMKSGR